jgi:hypothetical protein
MWPWEMIPAETNGGRQGRNLRGRCQVDLAFANRAAQRSELIFPPGW